MDRSNVFSVDSANKVDPKARKLELVTYLRDLTPGCKNLMIKYFAIKEEKSHPLLCEYLNVGLAFAAFGLLIRRENEQKMESEPQVKPMLQRVALESVLRKAMSKLQLLAFKAQFMQDHKAMEKNSWDRAIGKKVEEWQSEKTKLLQQLAEAKADVAEMKHRRVEDAKANAKVVAIFATQEHGWKIKKRKLMQEIELSKKHMDILQRQLEDRTPEVKSVCRNCKKRDTRIVNLKEQLGEKELEVMVTIEESKVEQIEKNELLNKLALAEVVAAGLQDRLEKEVKEHESDYFKHQEVIIELKSHQEQMEKELQETIEKLEASDGRISEIIGQKDNYEALVKTYTKNLEALNEKMVAMMAEKSEQDALIEEYQPKFAKLHDHIAKKDEVISAMLDQANTERGERHELSQELAQLKMELQQTQVEKERWRRIATEWEHINNQGELVKPIHSLECRDGPEEDRLAELQRLHEVKVRNLHDMYEARMQHLETQVRMYHEQLLEKENDLMLQISEEECSFSENKIAMKNMGVATSGLRDGMPRFDEIKEAETATSQMQLSVAKGLLMHNMEIEWDQDIELEKWKKCYMNSKNAVELMQLKDQGSENPGFENWVETAKARKAAQFTDKQWHEIDSFARQLRARDERLEAFRLQLLMMDKELNARKEETELMRSKLDHALEEKVELDTRLQERIKELEEYRGDVKLMETSGCKKLKPEYICHPNEVEQEGILKEFDASEDRLQSREDSTADNVGDVKDQIFASSGVAEAKTTPIQNAERTETSFRDKAFARTFEKQETFENQLKELSVYNHDYGNDIDSCSVISEENPKHLQPQEPPRNTSDLLPCDEEIYSTEDEGSLTKMPPALLFLSQEHSKDQRRSLMPDAEPPQSETSFDSFHDSESDSAEKSSSFPTKSMKCRAENKATIWGFFSRLRPTEGHSNLNILMKNKITKIEQTMKTGDGMTTSTVQVASTYNVGKEQQSREDLDANSTDASIIVGSTDTSQQTKSVYERATETVFELANNMQKIENQLVQLEKQLKVKKFSKGGSSEMENRDELHVAHLKMSLLKIIPVLKGQSRRYQALLGMMGRLCKRGSLNDSLELYSAPYSEAFPSILRLSLKETLNLQQHANLAAKNLTMIQAQISDEVSAASEEAEETGLSIQKHLEMVWACFKDVQHGLETKLLELIAHFEVAPMHDDIHAQEKLLNLEQPKETRDVEVIIVSKGC